MLRHEMKIAIMQPYFYPYIGYFQLIAEVDLFVIYDDIQYVKQSWINRNRILVGGRPAYISLPLKKDSDYISVNQRMLAQTWKKDRLKLLQKIQGNYAKAPYYKEVFPLLERLLTSTEVNLFAFLLNNLNGVLQALSITTEVIQSSDIGLDAGLRAEDKVLAICHALNATNYINPIGGIELYNKDHFLEQGIQLNFLKTMVTPYKQFESEHVPFLSIIDVLMFNSVDSVRKKIETEYLLC